MLKQAPVSRNEKAPVDFGYVGIDSILEQMRRKAMKQGFEFNIMVVGECHRPPRGPALAPAPDRLPDSLPCCKGGRWLSPAGQPVRCARNGCLCWEGTALASGSSEETH